jgi:hypothetical protein
MYAAMKGDEPSLSLLLSRGADAAAANQARAARCRRCVSAGVAVQRC